MCVVLLLLVYCPARRKDMVMHANLLSPSSSSGIAAGYDFCHCVSKQQIVASGHPSMQMIAHANGCLDCNLQEKQYDPIETPGVVSSSLQCCIQNSSQCNVDYKNNVSLISLEKEEEFYWPTCMQDKGLNPADYFACPLNTRAKLLFIYLCWYLQ